MSFRFLLAFSITCLGCLLLPTWVQAKTFETDEKTTILEGKKYEPMIRLFDVENPEAQESPPAAAISWQLTPPHPAETSILATDLAPFTNPSLGIGAALWPNQPASGAIESPLQVSQATESSPLESWRFKVLPNLFIPLDEGGSTFSESINYGLRLEAWNVDHNVTFFIEPSYRSRGYEDALANVVNSGRVPSDFVIEVDSDFWTVDVGLGYRFYDTSANPPAALTTEFDLPPVTFDLMAGARLFVTWNELEVNSNQNQLATLSRQQTWAEPLIGGRLRWNISDQVALLAEGEASGFGLGDLSFSWSAKAAVDWMVSGNTSLIAGYEISDFDYTVTSGNNSLRFDTTSHGPYVGLLIRF